MKLDWNDPDIQAQLNTPLPVPTPPAPVDPNVSTSVAGDMGRSLGIGLNQLGSLAGVGFRKVGMEKVGDFVKEKYDTRAVELESQLSAEQKAANATPFLSGDLTVPQGFRKVAGMVASSAPAMALGMGVGGAVTKGLMAAGTRAAAGTAATGLGGISTTTAGVIGGAGGEATVGAGLNYLDVYDQAQNLDMQAVPEYQTALTSITEGTPEERQALAREKVASALALKSAGIVGLATGVLGAPSGAAFAKLLGGETGKTALRTIGKQAGLEVLQEAPQSAVETYQVGETLATIDPSKRTTLSQVVESAVAGAITGGVMGGAMGGVGVAVAPKAEIRERALDLLKFKTQHPNIGVSDEAAAAFLSQAPLTGEGNEPITREAQLTGEAVKVEEPVTREETLRRERRAAAAPPELTEGEIIDAMPDLFKEGSQAQEEVSDLRPPNEEGAVAPLEPLKETPDGRVQTPEEVAADPPKIVEGKDGAFETLTIGDKATLELQPVEDEGKKYLRVEGVYVNQADRKQGLATALYAEAVAKAQREGYDGVISDPAMREPSTDKVWANTATTTVRGDVHNIIETKSVNPLTTSPEAATLPETLQGETMRQEPKTIMPVTADAERLFTAASAKLPEIAGRRDVLLRVAEGSAKLDGKTEVSQPHLAEAVQYVRDASPESGFATAYERPESYARKVEVYQAAGLEAPPAPDRVAWRDMTPEQQKQAHKLADPFTRIPFESFGNILSSRMGAFYNPQTLEVVLPDDADATTKASLVSLKEPGPEGVTPPPAQREDKMQAARRARIDDKRKTNPSYAPDIDSWKELLSGDERAEFEEFEELRYKSVALQGPEKGYKPYTLTAAQKARATQLSNKYLSRMQAEITPPQIKNEPSPAPAPPAGKQGVEATDSTRTAEDKITGRLTDAEIDTIYTDPILREKVRRGAESWELTKDEFTRSPSQTEGAALVTEEDAKKGLALPGGGQRKSAETLHALVVKNALAEGKPVPAEVLADYPDLQPTLPTKEGRIRAERQAQAAGLAPTPERRAKKETKVQEAPPAEKLPGGNTTRTHFAVPAGSAVKVPEGTIFREDVTIGSRGANKGKVTASALYYKRPNDATFVKIEPTPPRQNRVGLYEQVAKSERIEVKFSEEGTEETDLRAEIRRIMDLSPNEMQISYLPGANPIDALTAAIARETGKPVPLGIFKQVAAPKGQEALFAALAQTLKKEIVFFKNNGSPMSFNGATGIAEDTIYVNIDAAKPHLVVAGHEFLHDLKAEDPETYGALRDVVLSTIPAKQRRLEMWAGLNAKRLQEGRQAVDMTAVEEELVADFFGEQFTSKEFWAKVERRNPEGFAALVQKLVAFLERIKAALTGAARDDVQRAQTAAAEALARYVGKNPEAAYELSLSEPVLPATLTIDGVDRPTTNSNGKPLARTEEGVRNFWRWFGGSKVTDEQDRPLVVYHGTAADFSVFKVGAKGSNSNALGAWETERSGIFFTPSKTTAESFATQGARAGKVMEVYLRLEDPIDMRRGLGEGLSNNLEARDLNVRYLHNNWGKWELFDKDSGGDTLVQALKAEGYDGAILDGEDGVEYVVFDADQIKSATSNTGEFSTTNPDIRFSETPKANLARLKDSLLSGRVTTQALPSVLKVTPLSIVADLADAAGLPWVRTFYKTTMQRDAVSNGIVTDFGLLGKELAKTKESAKLVSEVADVASIHQMRPQDDIYKQDWIAAAMRGATEAKDVTKEGLLKGAQTAWEAAGMQESTGKTFREAYQAAKQAYDALPQDLQDQYLDAVGKMKALRQREKDAAQALIEEYTQDNPELRAEQIAQLNAAYNNLKGNYWPFYRKGDYTLDYVNKATGNREFSTHDTVFEREVVAKALVDAGLVDADTVKLSKKADAPKGSFGVPQGYNIALGKAIEDKAIADATQGIDPKDSEKIAEATAVARQNAQNTIQTLHEVWLRFQPEASAAKNMMRRKNIRGYDGDMVRGFLEYGQTHAVRVAQMEQGRKIEKTLNEMAAAIRGMGGDTTRPMAILNDLRAREAIKSQPTHWLAKKLGTWTTFKYMTSPSIALVQMTQLGILTLPKLATLKGSNAGKAAAALSRGTQAAFSTKFSRAKMYGETEVQLVFDSLHEVVTSDLRRKNPGKYDDVPLGTPVYTQAELQAQIDRLSPYQQQLLALHESMDRGLLDISLAHEVNEQVERKEMNPVLGKVFDLGMTFMRESEKASRKAAILAAFEVGGGDKDFFAGMETVTEVVDNTLFNYSKSAKGVALQGDLVRVLTTFQTFRINALGKLFVLFRQIVKGQTPEVQQAAKRELLGIFGMSGVLAGALGMPLGPAVFALFDAIVGDDDDEPAEEQFRTWLAENFGQTAADVAVEGVPSLLGASLSRRIGLGDVVGSSAEMPARLHGDGAFNWLATQAMGPAYSMLAGYAKGFNEIVNEGEIIKGLISSTPKPIGDALKAYGYAKEGVKTGMGKRLLTAEQVDANEVILQAFGFAPLEISRLKSKEYDLTSRSTKLSMEWGQIKQDLVKDYIEGNDLTEGQEKMREFVTKYPGFVRSPGAELRSGVNEYWKKDAGIDTPREAYMKSR